jgi:hypothetical protein
MDLLSLDSTGCALVMSLTHLQRISSQDVMNELANGDLHGLSGLQTFQDIALSRFPNKTHP